MNYISEDRSKPYILKYSEIEEMFYQNQIDEKQCIEITNQQFKNNNASNITNIINDIIFRDKKINGFMMNYPHGDIIRQGERSSYFRGEKEIYAQSQPSIFRKLNTFHTNADKKLYQLIADMRIAEFSSFLFNFERTVNWEKYIGSVLIEPLSQHYGLDTKWLDITNDFAVALFFSNCYWDNTKQKWYPLTDKDTEKSSEKQYGVIFHTPAYMANLSLIENSIINKSIPQQCILPIGYQPYMRCHSQYAYGMYMEEPLSLQNNIKFEQLYFRHNKKLAYEIYEYMEGGEKIYPHEGLRAFQDIIDNINTTDKFSEEALFYAFGKNHYYNDIDNAIKDLQENTILNKPITIQDKHPFSLSRQRINRFNRKNGKINLTKEYGINLSYRKMFI